MGRVNDCLLESAGRGCVAECGMNEVGRLASTAPVQRHASSPVTVVVHHLPQYISHIQHTAPVPARLTTIYNDIIMFHIYNTHVLGHKN